MERLLGEKAELAGFDFKSEINLPPLPNQLPNQLPKEYSSNSNHSSSVETLISQNEDLMARLKVTLRRLSALEQDYEQVKKHLTNMSQAKEALADQLLIWKEKEIFWHQKNNTLENNLKDFEGRFPEYSKMHEKIERYQKYHEKVRTQVKPYIQQLKNFAQQLTVQIHHLNLEVEEKHLKARDLEKQYLDFKIQSEQDYLDLKNKNTELIQSFENEKILLLETVSQLKSENLILEEKALQVEKLLDRQDELENTVIALNRSRNEQEELFQKENSDLKHSVADLKKSLIEEKISSQDSQKKVKGLEDEIQRQKHRADQLQEQLSSLRYLWTNKCQEMEKNQIAFEALEKVNQELSARLNQLRKGSATL